MVDATVLFKKWLTRSPFLSTAKSFFSLPTLLFPFLWCFWDTKIQFQTFYFHSLRIGTVWQLKSFNLCISTSQKPFQISSMWLQLFWVTSQLLGNFLYWKYYHHKQLSNWNLTFVAYKKEYLLLSWFWCKQLITNMALMYLCKHFYHIETSLLIWFKSVPFCDNTGFTCV